MARVEGNAQSGETLKAAVVADLECVASWTAVVVKWDLSVLVLAGGLLALLLAALLVDKADLLALMLAAALVDITPESIMKKA